MTMNLDTVNIITNIVLGVVAWLMSRMINSNDKRIDALEKRDDEHTKDISALREIIPQHYVRRDDFKDLGDNIFTTLRRIEDKLDKKVDK